MKRNIQSMTPVSADRKPKDAIEPVLDEHAIRINNAGLVILQSFIGQFFSRLGLTENNRFVSDNAQHRAVHYLQFLVTGCCETQQRHLMLSGAGCSCGTRV